MILSRSVFRILAASRIIISNQKDEIIHPTRTTKRDETRYYVYDILQTIKQTEERNERNKTPSKYGARLVAWVNTSRLFQESCICDDALVCFERLHIVHLMSLPTKLWRASRELGAG